MSFPPVGRAVRCCGAVVRAGRRPVWPDLRKSRAGVNSFWALDFSYAGISLLLLADNYIWQLRAKPQRHEGTKDAQRDRGSLQHRYPCGAVGSSARLPLDCGCFARLPVALVACLSWAGPSGGCCAARQGGLACLTSAHIRGQGAGRAEITGSREGAKPRSSDEKRTIFRQSPWAASVEPFLGKGHPGPQCLRFAITLN